MGVSGEIPEERRERERKDDQTYEGYRDPNIISHSTYNDQSFWAEKASLSLPVAFWAK